MRWLSRRTRDEERSPASAASIEVEERIRAAYSLLAARDEELRGRFERLLAHEEIDRVPDELLDRTRSCLEANEEALSNRVLTTIGRGSIVEASEFLGRARGRRVAIGRRPGDVEPVLWALSPAWRDRIQREIYSVPSPTRERHLYHDMHVPASEVRAEWDAGALGTLPADGIEPYTRTHHVERPFEIETDAYDDTLLFTVIDLLDLDELMLDEERARVETLRLLFHDEADGADRLRQLLEQLEDRLHNTARRITAAEDLRSRLEHDEDADEEEDAGVAEVEGRWRRMQRAIEEMDISSVEREI